MKIGDHVILHTNITSSLYSGLVGKVHKVSGVYDRRYITLEGQGYCLFNAANFAVLPKNRKASHILCKAIYEALGVHQG